MEWYIFMASLKSTFSVTLIAVIYFCLIKGGHDLSIGLWLCSSFTSFLQLMQKPVSVGFISINFRIFSTFVTFWVESSRRTSSSWMPRKLFE